MLKISNATPKTFAALLPILIFVLVAVLQTENLMAQGKLGRVSSAVRKHQPSPPKAPSKPKNEPERRREPEPKPRRERKEPEPQNEQRKINNQRNNVRQHGDRNHQHPVQPPRSGGRNNNHRRHHSRSSGIIFAASPAPCLEPVIVPVVEQVYVRPVYAEPIPTPVITEVPVLAPVSPQVVIQPTQISNVEPTISSEIGIPQSSFFEANANRIWATVGSDFDGVDGGELGVHFQCPGSFGIESSVVSLRESGTAFRDHLWIGDVNLVYEVFNTQHSRGRLGVGVNWLSDAWGSEAGMNLNAGIDVLLTDRLVFAGETNLGTLGDADFFSGRVSLARQMGEFEVLVGGEHLNIGGAEINRFFTGIQLRF